MEIIAKRYIWSAVATEYLSQRCKQQGVKWNLCEVCHKIVKDIQVHHKIPVHTLDASNYKLVWDLTKLIAVCIPCHGKQHRKVNLEIKMHQYTKIEQFLRK